MSLGEKLQSVRQKPRAVRSQVAFTGALVVTALVAIVWMGTLPNRVISVNENTNSRPVAENTRPGAWERFKNSASVFLTSSKKSDAESVEPVEPPNNTIDMNKLLEGQSKKRTPAAPAAAPATTSGADAGSVILIATSTATGE